MPLSAGNQGMTPGPVMFLSDASVNDHIGFYGATSDAAAGNTVDVMASIRLQSNDQPSGIETRMRLIIDDEAVTSVIVGFVTLGGVPGVAIALGSNFSGAENYGGFVPVDWLNPVTLTIRRHASGAGEIVEVNGAAPLVTDCSGPNNRTTPKLP